MLVTAREMKARAAMIKNKTMLKVVHRRPLADATTPNKPPVAAKKNVT